MDCCGEYYSDPHIEREKITQDVPDMIEKKHTINVHEKDNKASCRQIYSNNNHNHN